jgi:hypothetical protein
VYSNPYQATMTARELNSQLLIGLKRHLLISQDTSAKKEQRLNSLNNISDVLEYVSYNVNDSIPEEERAILARFFRLLLTKVRSGIINIHSRPETFHEEIAFINILLKI